MGPDVAPAFACRPVRRNARGFIVVAVLWILAALSGLVLIYLTYVTNTAVVVAATTDRVLTGAMMTAGVELAVYQLTGLTEEIRPSSGTFSARVGAGKVSVTFQSEAARVDLNLAPKALLTGLMVGLGSNPSDAADYADRIVAWRKTTTAAGENDPENSFYRTSGASYLPRHAGFPEAEELWLVRGIPPQVVESIMPFVTVFSDRSAVNILDAAPQVLAALPTMSPDNLQSVLSQRGDPTINPQSLLAMVGGEGATITPSKAYRITIAAELAGGRRSAAEVVILLLENSDQPYAILSWRNASDGGTALQKALSR